MNERPAAPVRADKSWARAHFRGLENVLIPSFKDDLHTLDEAGLRLDVEQSIAHGCFATLCALDAGLAPAEQRRMIELACDTAAGRIEVGVALHGPLEQDLELLAAAQEAGASHALVGFPQDFRPASDADVVAYVAERAEATDLGLVLYHADKFALHHLHPSGVPFAAYEALAERDNVIALKIGGLESGTVLECCERFHESLLVTSVNLGMLPILVAEFGVQWSGAWTVEALQSPDKPYAVEFFDLLRDGRMDAAMQVYWQLSPALGMMLRLFAPLTFTGTYHWPLLKYYQWLSGGNGGMVRQPCMRLFSRDMAAVRDAFGRMGIECADPDTAFFDGRRGVAAGREQAA